MTCKPPGGTSSKNVLPSGPVRHLRMTTKNMEENKIIVSIYSLICIIIDLRFKANLGKLLTQKYGNEISVALDKNIWNVA